MLSENYLLHSDTARMLYNSVKNAPICDYHCHLSPKMIYEDLPFENIAQMWLDGDHYKWRLMRCCGIDERFITGNAPWKEKFKAYVRAIQLSAGNPLYDWTKMELSIYFGIDTPLCEQNADEIYALANDVILRKKLSPKKLIQQSNVKYIATTDDIIDDLQYHKKLNEQPDFDTVIAPSFRTDNLLLIRRHNYREYIAEIAAASDTDISDISTLCKALVKRLDYFCNAGCKMTDVGIMYFPPAKYMNSTAEQADTAFKKALYGGIASDEEYFAFLGYMYRFLAAEYKKRELVMQLHLNVYRNANTMLYNLCGADAGGDCVGDSINVSDVIALLDAINNADSLPRTIIYTLNGAASASLAVAAAAFRNVSSGAAWWFCDTKRGIINQLKTIAECSSLGSFTGMLTDSRSFLSYARHDYFRRILCNEIAILADNDEFDKAAAKQLVKYISFDNAAKMVGILK